MFALLWEPSTNKWTPTIKPGKAHDLQVVAASVGRGAGGAEGRKLEWDRQSPSPLLRRQGQHRHQPSWQQEV